MRIKSESEILDPAVRGKILEEICGPENKQRKDKYYRRHKIYKDFTAYFVRAFLLRQFDQKTVEEMSYALSNISITRKIIDKLARVYNSGVQRSIVDDAGNKIEEATKNLDELVKILDIDTHQKTINRYLKLHRNDLTYLKPCPYEEDGQQYMTIIPEALAPYLYDVVEDYYDRTEGVCYILSNYSPTDTTYSTVDAAKEGRSIHSTQLPTIGDGTDQTIADKKEDEGLNNKKKQFIWWSDSYHFTTDENGNVVDSKTGNMIDISTPEGLSLIANPVGEDPFVDYGIDKDNSYWAEGGDDLADSSVLINSLLTHINHIGITQGYGQFWMKGKNLPRNITIGANKAILLEYETDDPVPDLGFANASPNLSDLMKIVEMQAALLLTTNNLSTSGVSTQLSGSNGFASGIALMIDKSESMEDVSDQRQIFLDNEPELWEKLNKWLIYFQSENVLDPELVGLQLPENAKVVVNFQEPRILQTEGEKLDNIQKRKDLGLNTMEELLKIDQPDLTDEQAKKKLTEITAQKADRMKEMAQNTVVGGSNAGAQDQLNGAADQLGNRPGDTQGPVQ